MEVKKQENQQNWDNWINKTSPNSPFSQSWDWGDILISEGKKVERLAVLDNNETLLQAQVVYTKLPFGMRYAFCPKGPVIKSKTLNIRPKILEELFLYFKKRGVIFLRIETSQELKINKTSYKLQDTRDINPKSTLILNLRQREDVLLQEMHSKTRYNIRLAERKGVVIKQEKNFDEFWRLMEMTGERDGFRLHFKDHYQKILDSKMSIQLNAVFEDKIIATAVFLKFGKTFTYLYGASDYSYRKVMAPNLLQWEGIKLSKGFGYKKYDFFGIAPMKDGDYDKKHQYSGVTRFKLGFGGDYHEDSGTFDIVINKQKYFIYKILRKVRRLF